MQIRSTTVMTMLTVAACFGRFSSAFTPQSRSFAARNNHGSMIKTSRNLLSSSSSSKVVGGKGLRRSRPQWRADSLDALIKKLQRTEGVYTDYKHGEFPLPATLTSSAEGSDVTELPSVFPYEGKDMEEVRDNVKRMRFAPSPTGSLHVGGARTALYNWLLAKKGQYDAPDSDSAFVLRVEDTDLARSTKESEKSVLDDLRWLGLDWDEGPDDVNAKYKPYRQSERGEIYRQAALKLLQEGKAYRCFCTPEELEEMKAQQEAQGLQPRYDGRWRDADPALVNKMLDEGRPFTIRFKVLEGSRVVIDDAVRGTVAWDAAATVGDFILLRSNGIPVYNFCVAIDDAMMAITTVVRAEEHLTNTLRQALTLDALGAPRPKYAHCALILGEDKQKLSKRHGATSCNQFRLDGFLSDAMINYLALLGWADGSDNEIFTREELIDAFEMERIVKSPSVFDMEKLKWVNSQHMKRMSIEEVMEYVKEQLELEGLLKDDTSLMDIGVIDFSYAATSLAKQMMETTKDAVLNAKTVLGYGLPATYDELQDKSQEKKMIQLGHFYSLAKKIVGQYESNEFPLPDADYPLAAFQDEKGNAIEEDNQNGAACSFTSNYKSYMKSLAKEYKLKGKNLFHPVRLALTGEMSGQDVTKQLSLVSMATQGDVIDKDRAGLVTLDERIDRLKVFLESIPEEFHAPKQVEKKSKDEKNNQQKDAKSQQDTAVVAGTVDPLSTYEGPPITALDIRVGQITKVWEHEEADKLYCEEIDIGEDEPRTVASGLRPYLSTEDLEGKKVLVLCNLKKRNMVGFPSHGMLLCASNEDHSVVKIVNPPIDAKIGERVTFPDVDFTTEDAEPFGENKIGKKKVFQKLAPFLITSKYGVPEFCGRPFMTSAGVCTTSIPDGTVS